MDTILLAVLGFVVLIGLALVTFGVVSSRRRRTVDERLAELGTFERPPTLEDIELAQPFSERILSPLVGRLAQAVMRFTPGRSTEAIRHKLDLAGNPYGWGAAEYLGVRALVAIIFGGLGFALVLLARHIAFVPRLVVAGVAVVLGYFLPVLWLASKIKRRQSSIVKSLPNALDLLTICVEAGLGFDMAMDRVADKWDDDLSQAFRRVLQELSLGKLRREALRDMSDRMEVPDVGTFVAAIIQADQLGVSLARVLRIQSDQMRTRRRQRAEELARAAPIKMIPAIAFLIFPAIFVVLLGPAAIRLMQTPIFGF
jgi:tight adherence protein C